MKEGVIGYMFDPPTGIWRTLIWKIRKFLDLLMKYNEWLFKLAFKDVFKESDKNGFRK